MSSPVRCSVIVPTRDSPQHLRNALRSVRQQKIREIEIIVGDDGSSDGTMAWLRARNVLRLALQPGTDTTTRTA